MTRIFIFIQLIILLFTHCKENSGSKSQNPQDQFDSLMISLANKYQEIPKADSNKYSRVYHLSKRLFIPGNLTSEETCDITLELREYTPCGGCWTYQVVYIYNDSIHYLLPLTDFYIYWKHFPEKEQAEKLNLVKELNNLVSTNKIKSPYFLIDAIMTHMIGYHVVTRYDIPKLKMFADEAQIVDAIDGSSLYPKKCVRKVYENLKIIEKEVETGSAMIYTDGKLVFIFDYNENAIIKMRVLNSDCLIKYLW